MTKIETLLGRATVIIPFFHVFTCGLYLAGYSLGFGGNIGGLFSPSDFFTITIQKLVVVYALGLVIPSTAIILRHRVGKTYAHDIIEQEREPARQSVLRAKHIRIRSCVIWASHLLLIPTAICVCLLVWTGTRVDYYAITCILMVSGTPSWWRFCDYINFLGLPAELTWSVLFFVASVLSLGLNAGEIDRRGAATSLANGKMRCGDHVVISPIGDRFISASPDNRRHLINEDCKVQFDFAPAKAFPEEGLLELLAKKLD